MDEIVKAAMRKWPTVPYAYGWLSLDRRGAWLLKGERIGNAGMTDFIGRNYHADERGRWFFQNGPQRVFVTLALTPWIYRLSPPHRLVTHTGQPVRSCLEAWCTTDGGEVLLLTEYGIGAIDDRDLPAIATCLTDGSGIPLSEDGYADWMTGGTMNILLHIGGTTLSVGRIDGAEVARRFRFEPAPRPDPGEPEC